MQDGTIEAQVVELPAMLVAGLRCEGSDAGSGEHWQRFRAWLVEHEIASFNASVLAVAYVPPLAFGATRVVELCVPVEVTPGEAAREAIGAPCTVITRTLGGRFVLASGTPADAPVLVRSAQRFAAAHALAFERGSITIYRPGATDDELRVEAGVRIHD
ncbi:MAG TPA: GyrI-like domain-containing protein [Dehalococcoidia bacterium]